MNDSAVKILKADIYMNATIAIVEDDKELSRLTVLLLEAEGFKCIPIYRGGHAAEIILEHKPDLVILDIMLPDKSGVEICTELRQSFLEPILMLTGRGDDITELASFKNGADDYIVKPIKPHLLIARIQALLKRGKHNNTSNSREVLHGDAISVNLSRREVLIADKLVDLSDSEFDLLVILVENLGAIVSREECFRKLRGFDYDGLDRSIDMRVSSLRKKISPFLTEKQRVLTVRNRGYMLTDGT